MFESDWIDYIPGGSLPETKRELKAFILEMATSLAVLPGSILEEIKRLFAD